MPGNVRKNRAQGANAQWIVPGNREVVLTVLLRREPHMTPSLARHLITEFAKYLCQLIS